jgi:hypothetical protein
MNYLRQRFLNQFSAISYLFIFLLIFDICNLDTFIPNVSRVSLDDVSFLAVIDEYHNSEQSLNTDIDDQTETCVENDKVNHSVKLYDLDSSFYEKIIFNAYHFPTLLCTENNKAIEDYSYSSPIYLENCSFLN